jgi:predicted PurR-regulated permease PerM
LSFGRWLGLGALVAALLLLWSLREAMLLIFAAVVVATALCTIVGRIRAVLGCRRRLALALALLAIVLVVGVGAAVIIPPFTTQFSQLISKLPQAAHALLKLLQGGLQGASRMLYGSDDTALNSLWESLGQPAEGGNALATGLGGALRLVNFAGNVGGALLKILFVLAVALMIAAQPQAYQEVALLLCPSFYRRRFRQVILRCGEALSAWMVGVLISSVCVGAMAAIGLTLLGVKLVAANAVLAGVLNIIPNVGPTLSTLFPMSMALLESPWRALAVLGLYVLIQNLESYVITPSVMHHQLQLLPGLTLTAQLLFTVVFGPLGLLLALPMAVCLQVLLRDVLIHDILDSWNPRRLLR